jgi:hypothetical protein
MRTVAKVALVGLAVACAVHAPSRPDVWVLDFFAGVGAFRLAEWF